MMSVLNAHKSKLFAVGEAKENIEGFSKFINDLNCFQAVSKFCIPNLTPFSDELVVNLLKKKNES